MNFLRLRPTAHTVTVLARTYATAPFVPPRSLDNIDPRSFTATLLPRPTSPTFYTARSDFFDGVRLLEDAVKSSQRALRATHLVPFPDAAKRNLPPARLAWKNSADLAQAIGAELPTSRLRRVQGLLGQLNDLRRIALAGAEDDIATRISGILEPFERPDKDLLRGRRKPVLFDEYGRTYALGKRKESAARVWMIPVRIPEAEAAAQPEQQAAQELEQNSEKQAEQKPEKQPPQQPAQRTTQQPSRQPIQHPAERPAQPPTSPAYPQLVQLKPAPPPRATPHSTTILVNALPLATYFPNATDRARVVRPLKLAGVLGAFNVFALVRGGGTTGQAGAVAHGIAKNIVAHVPEVELILRRAKVLKRDPRMVERKKTGLAKARKRYTWVKR